MATAQVSVRPNVIYGTDDRLDLYRVTDPAQMTQAASVCALVRASDLAVTPAGATLSTNGFTYRGLPPCEGEPYATQPTAPFCSGFVVGEDLIATAGHCFSEGDQAGVYFLFGFEMLDATTPVTSFAPEQVYRAVQLVARELTGTGPDYSIVRVDRPISVAPPLPIRRAGTIAPGTAVGVIGHPWGLPKKVAFGPSTTVRSSNVSSYFTANLDTYGGNSGSPVFNALTGVVEGILVRGEADFLTQTGCFLSNRIGDEAGQGEDATKTTVFARFIPELVNTLGVISFAANAASCGRPLELRLLDSDLAGMPTVQVLVTSEFGDSEPLTLSAIDEEGRFAGTISLATGAPQPSDGVLQVADGSTVSAAYADADQGEGSPGVATATLDVDCNAPQVSDVELLFVGATQAVLSFTTDEPASTRVRWGGDCAALTGEDTGSTKTEHVFILLDLAPSATFYYDILVTDAAGNSALDDNGGVCFSGLTLTATDYLTEQFDENVDIANTRITFTPDAGPVGYTVCTTASVSPPALPGANVLNMTDDASVLLTLSDGKSVKFFGDSFADFYLSSNGYITFGLADSTFTDSLSNHFARTRLAFFFDDLNPLKGGVISWKQGVDRVSVFFDAVAEWDQGGGAVTALVEMFFDGRLQITYGDVTIGDGTIGLSRGLGVPSDFVASNFVAYSDCEGTEGAPEGSTEGTVEGTPEGQPEGETEGGCTPDVDRTQNHSADLDGNGRILLSELLRVIQFYNSGGYACDASAIGGYAPGAGAQDCFPHHSDFLAPAWQISLQELLRLIQFFGSPGYTTSACTADGFAIVP